MPDVNRDPFQGAFEGVSFGWQSKTEKIQKKLDNYQPKPYGDYGTGDTQLDTPKWLQDLSKFGFGKGYEQARFQNESRGIVEQSRYNLAGLEKQSAAQGIGGGFAEQNLSRAYGAEFRGLETLRNTISTENQNAMIQGQQGMLDLEQSNANRALQFQTAMANQDFALFQLLIQEMQAERDVYTQKHHG